MTRLSRYGAKLAEIDREVAAFSAQFGAYHVETGEERDGINVTVNGVLNPVRHDVTKDLANQFRGFLLRNLYDMHIDAHMLGALHEWDNGAHLTSTGWRLAEGCGL
jgi:hypothetical protein